MKKIIGIILCLVLILGLAACGSDNYNDTYVNDTNNSESSSEITSENDSEKDELASAIDGLVDTAGSPAGNIYDGIDGKGFTTEFFNDFTCRATVSKNGELKDIDDWEFLEDGIIRKIYRKDKTIYSDYFIYKDYLIRLGASVEWGTLEGDGESGYTNNQTDDGDRIIKKDGTYSYNFLGGYEGTYTMLEERIMFIDSKDKWGEPFTIYLFIDNDNAVHYAYPKVK